MHMFNLFGGGGMMFVFWGALAVFAIWLGQILLGQNKPQQHPQNLTVEENIRLRYSRGELSRDEYLMMLEDVEVIKLDSYEKSKRSDW